jgi:hypothetical protein
MRYIADVALDDILYIPIFMKIGTGVQVILRFYLRNLKGCNVGITHGTDICSAPLKRIKVARYKCQVSWRSVQAFK